MAPFETASSSPFIIQQPISEVIAQGSPASFSVVASGTPSIRYQWMKNGSVISGATDATFSIAAASSNDSATYIVTIQNSVGSISSVPVTLTVDIPPSIAQQPQSQTVSLGANVGLSVAAAGTAPFSYQWNLNGASIAGATGASLNLSNVQNSNAGNYSVLIKNAVGQVTSSNAVVTIGLGSPGTAPSILSQPNSLMVTQGGSANFNVVGQGTGPLSYQWQLNGINIAGATNAAFSIAKVQNSSAGSYTVTLSNLAGSIVSRAAILKVNSAPTITSQPTPQTVSAGATVSLSVQASGTGTLSYQWLFDGNSLDGQTSSTLLITKVQSANMGNYSVTVTNLYGSITSATAALTVTQVAPTGNYFYVLSGATGNNSGADWLNAFKSLPTKLVRGATYYVGGGSYPSYIFNDAESGTSTITIKKATALDHGTNTGWQASYGTSQSVFNSTLQFNAGYYIFDGQYRNEGNWYDGTQYGFSIANNGQDENIIIYGNSAAASNITIQYVYVNAIYGNLPSQTIRRYAIDTDTYTNIPGTHQNLVFSHLYVYGGNNIWFVRYTNNTTIEYSVSDYATGNSDNHGEIVNLYYNAENAIIRFNQFSHAYLTGGGTALIADTQGSNGQQIYGNIFSNFQCGDGAIGFATTGDMSNSVIYNNTIVNGLAASGFAAPKGTNNLVYNNLWVANAAVGIDGTHNYNSFSGGSTYGEANGQANVLTNVFSGYASSNFSLATATASGFTLPSPYNLDLTGRLRGTGGTWDRGAYQH